MKTSEKGSWSASIFVNCPYCGEQQDLLESDDGDVRVSANLVIAEHGTERTINQETHCIDCNKDFIVPDLEW